MSTFDAQQLCGHAKALLSGFVPNELIVQWVGKVNSMTFGTKKSYFSEVATIFTRAMAGVDPVRGGGNNPPCTFSHISFTRDRSGNIVWSDPLIQALYEMEWASPSTQKIWAGMTNLKSTLFRLDSKLSRSERKDALSTILHQPKVDEQLVTEWKDFCKEFVPLLIPPTWKDEYMPLWAFPASDRRFVTVSRDNKLICLPRTDDYLYDPLPYFKIREVHDLALRDPGEFLSRTLFGTHVNSVFEEPLPAVVEGLPVGMIRIAPKNGGKPRIVSIVNTMCASLSYPLARKLAWINSNWNIQFVDNQDAAKAFLQEFLRNNVGPDAAVIRSFDQSAFTDNFPYDSVQRVVLEVLMSKGYITPYDIDIMDAVTHANYDMSALKPGFIGRFGTGTQMGVYPSFSLGSLSNGIIVAFAYTRVRGEFPKLKGDPYATVVGDDNTVLDYHIANECQSIYERFGMKINYSKTVESSIMAEFCSTLITGIQENPKKKIPEFVDFEALKTPIEYYGREAFQIGWPRFKDVSQEILEIPRPQGLGDTIDLDHRWDNSPIETIMKAEARAKELSDLNPIVMPAQDAMAAFNRAGVDASGTQYEGYPIQYFAGYSERKVNRYYSGTEYSPVELSMLKEAEQLARTVSEASNATSDIVQDAADRLYEIYRIFKLKYPNRFRERKTVFSILRKEEGPHEKRQHHSDVARLVEKNRQAKQLSENRNESRQKGGYHER